ncbi:MAG: 2OG-Fe(II) oxygenase [Rubrivivax sp.]
MNPSASAPAVTPALRQWLLDQLAAGCVAADILESMRNSGWDGTVALAALNQALASTASPLLAAEPARPATTATALPAPDLGDAPSLIPLAGHSVQLLMALSQPQVLLFGQLLSHEECDALVALATPRMARSETVDHSTGGSQVNAARTSEGMFFERGETALIQRIEARIAELLRWPVDKGEGLQVLRYQPGAQYEPHFDYFDPAQPGTPAVLRRGGQRLATLIMYLNTPERGGATIFPDLRLQVAPTKGCAVFFSYDRPHESTGTLHGGAPVLQGEKWVATKWLREGVFE